MTATLSPETIGACVFDAYGTLFDLRSATARCAESLGDRAEDLGRLWRSKQLEYTWLRSLMSAHADFWQVTASALDYALAETGLDDPVLRSKLMEVYLRLDPYPAAGDALRRLQEAGLRTAVLSNGSPVMLTSAVSGAGLHPLIGDLLSAEAAGVYKPHPAVYRLACDHLDLPADRICFVSANNWDAHGATAFGFVTVWVDRQSGTDDLLPGAPAHRVADLDALPGLFGV